MSKQWPARVTLTALVAATLSVGSPAYAQQPPELILDMLPMDTVQHPLQTDAYTISVKAGSLQLRARPVPDALFEVVLRDMSATRVLFRTVLQTGRPDATVTIPADGQYLLYVTRYTADGKDGHNQPLDLTGPELQGDMYVPTIMLDNIHSGQAISAPLTVKAYTLHYSPVQYLKLRVDDGPATDVLRPDGYNEPYTIDPAKLKEGVHTLRAVAQPLSAQNIAIAPRVFVVDRFDSFTDVPRGYWGRTPIEAMADQGILSGRGGGKFDPEAPVTREEFAKMFALVSGLKAPATGGAEFADIPADAWSRQHVQALAAANLIKGERVDGIDYFRPKRQITRAEAATIVGRSLGVTDSTVIEGSAEFTDFADVPVWAKASVTLLSRGKWLNGFEDGSFRPNEMLSRAQAAKMLSRSLGL